MRRQIQNRGGKATASQDILVRAGSVKEQSIGTYYCDSSVLSIDMGMLDINKDNPIYIPMIFHIISYP
eukprot:4203049-Pleurochrysis_carterae.AAC.1